MTTQSRIQPRLIEAHRIREYTRLAGVLPQSRAPSLDVLARIGEVLDFTTDLLVADTAPRRPLHAPENALSGQLTDFATLDPDDQPALLKVLDALVTKAKLRAITGGAG